VKFLNISQASLEETRYYMILANDLEYADTHEFVAQLDEVSRMLDAYVRTIEGR
jgi:four helix bundle protein